MASNVKIIFIVLLFIIVAYFPKSYGQPLGFFPEGNNNCKLIINCNDCIGTEGCVWCSNHEFEAKDSPSKNIPRCDTLQNHRKRKDGYCGSNEYLEIPQSQKFVDENRKIDQNKKVHISPQRGRVQLAVGMPVTFDINYLEDADKQLDLYYILDLSHTMKDDKDTVAAESHKLAGDLKNKLTKSVRLGFGSFVDKPVMPFASYSQINIKTDQFVKPYGFKNHLSLTDDINAFKYAVENSEISANIDMAEGGFDAIMQAIVCSDIIGWRQNGTHKLVVIASDGPFHIKGDGKLGGIVEPNDMECHLDARGMYTHSTILDYPSVGQINHVVKESKTYIIFAVTQDHYELYSQLSKRIERSTTGRLRSNSGNVVELVTNQYNNLKGNVKLTEKISEGSSPLLSNYLDFQYEAKCTDDDNWISSNNCQNVGPGKSVRFRVTIKLQKCPPPDLRGGEITFTTFELDRKEEFRLAVNLVCDCNCTKTSSKSDFNPALLTSICNGHGKRLQCGKCVCEDGHSGSNCECSAKDEDEASAAGSGSSFLNSNRTSCLVGENDLECSGRGECTCGQCDCKKFPGWSGPRCECDQTKCRVNPQNDYERECANRGKCICDKCFCNEDRGGEKCQCSKEQNTCMEPGTTSICNGNGNCTCSKEGNMLGTSVDWDWTCNSCKIGYYGQFCHVCRGANCQSKDKVTARCQDPKLMECIQCHMKEHLNNTWLQDYSCQTTCGLGHSEGKTKQPGELRGYHATIVSSLSEFDGQTSIICDTAFNDTCTVSFLYEYESLEDGGVILRVKIGKVLYCPPPINILPIILWAAGGVIFIGLLTLLLWKLFTFMMDTREYNRFEKDRANAKWAKGENPLYNTPMSTFQNPAYRS